MVQHVVQLSLNSGTKARKACDEVKFLNRSRYRSNEYYKI